MPVWEWTADYLTLEAIRAFGEHIRLSQSFIKSNRKNKMVIIEIGAGTAIPTVRIEGEKLAKRYDTKLIRINPREYEIDPKLGYSIPFGGLDGIMEIYQDKTDFCICKIENCR